MAFKGYNVRSWVKKFDWKEEESLAITCGKWNHQNDATSHVTGNTINELIENVKATYEKQYRSDIVQPYLKDLFVMQKKKQEILSILPKDLVQAIEDKDNEKIFNDLADFLIEKEIIS